MSLKGSAYVVIDGVDGRARITFCLPHLDAARDSARRARSSTAPVSRMPLDGPTRDRRFDRNLAIKVENGSGATWLDRQLVAKEPIALSEGGFDGAEVREAISARIDHHVEEGLARRQGQRVVFARRPA